MAKTFIVIEERQDIFLYEIGCTESESDVKVASKKWQVLWRWKYCISLHNDG